LQGKSGEDLASDAKVGITEVRTFHGFWQGKSETSKA
jgi:hypothetical protein